MKFYNLLNKERSVTSFSWRTFYQFFGKLLFENQLNLPLAAIAGVTEYTFIESESFDLVSNTMITGVNASASASASTDGGNIRSSSDWPETPKSSLKSITTSVVAVNSFNVSANENIRDFATSDAELSTSVSTATGVAAATSPQQPCQKLITKWKLVSGNERINLIQSVTNNQLKNRILANHLLEFLDSRKPRTIGINEWNSIVLTQLPGISKIPGMNQFDIDGLDNSFGNTRSSSNYIAGNQEAGNGQQQPINSNLEKVNQVLFYATSLVLFVGVAFSVGMFNRIFFNDGHSF